MLRLFQKCGMTKEPNRNREPEPSEPSLSFLSLFFGKRQGKPPKKTRIFYPYRTPKIPGAEGKKRSKNKEILAGGKKGNPKKQGKEGQGFFPKPKAEPEPPEPFSRNRNRNQNRPFLLNCTENKERPFLQRNRRNRKPGTARTVPPPNRNRTEPNRGLPEKCGMTKCHGLFSF